MAKVYYDQDADLEILRDRTVAVIGYGSQGRAQALNMNDSGLNVVVGLREGKSWKAAKSEGLEVQSVSEAAEMGDLIIMLIPDMVQPEVYRKSIAPSMKEGKAIGFSHGFNIHFGQVKPPETVDVIMVAPKSPGARLRELYKEGFGVPALFAVHQNPSGEGREKALAWAKALGCTRAGVLETTFKDETESDLIGEQTVLVGGLIELINNGFKVLVEEGYPAELAYFEACNEAKLIMDLIYQKGITGMLKAVSDTAKYGGLTVGKKVIDEKVKQNMKRAAARVKNRVFAEEWISEYEKGMPKFNQLMKEVEDWEIEKVGRTIRKMAGIER